MVLQIGARQGSYLRSIAYNQFSTLAEIAATLVNASGVGCDTNRRTSAGHMTVIWQTYGGQGSQVVSVLHDLGGHRDVTGRNFEMI